PQQPVVARACRRELHEHRREPLAEETSPLAEGRNQLEPAAVRDPARHLDREPKIARRLRRPVTELLLCRELIEGRVQLDRRELLGEELEELRRLRLLRVEASA